MNTFLNLSLQDRPYEKVKKYGPSILTDVELLAIFIRNGYKDKSCIDIANDMLGFNKDGRALLQLVNKNLVDLTKYDGIGEVKAIQLICMLELSRRIWRQSKTGNITFNNADVISDYYMEEMRHLPYEKTKLLLLNKKCNLIKDIDLSIGTVDSALISSRDIFINALKYEAVNIILVHNHPSGDPEPSKADYIATDNVLKAGKLIGIELLDHIIIGDNTKFSFAVNGYIN